MDVAKSSSMGFDGYARPTSLIRRPAYIPFHRLLSDVRREFMQRLSIRALHGTLGSYLRDALQRVVHMFLHASLSRLFNMLGGFHCFF
jgi:hypothetical protein